MADNTEMSIANQYEFEMTASREEIADELTGVVDGFRSGAIRMGSGADAVRVDVPDDLSLEIEFEEEGGEVSLELELEWPASGEDFTDLSIENRPQGNPKDPTLVGAIDGSESLARFEVFRDRGNEWRWRLRHGNGNIIATSGEGYTRKHNALKGLRSVMENSPDASVNETATN